MFGYFIYFCSSNYWLKFTVLPEGPATGPTEVFLVFSGLDANNEMVSQFLLLVSRATCLFKFVIVTLVAPKATTYLSQSRMLSFRKHKFCGPCLN